MIIHTKKIIKNIGIKFLEEGKEIINVVKGEEKIKFILFKGKMTTNKIYKKTNLKPRTVRQCLLKLEKKGKVKRIKAFIRWSENVVLVKNNLDDSEIPNHLRDFWDTSVEIGDVEDYIDFQIDISHYPLTESDYIEFLFADECKVREGNSFNDLYFLNGADVCAENAQKKLMLKGD